MIACYNRLDSAAAQPSSRTRLHQPQAAPAQPRRVSQHYDASSAPTGLKNTQYSLLSHVVQLGPIRPANWPARMEMDASTLDAQPAAAGGAGLGRVGPGDDARSRFVSATEAGRAKRTEAQREWKRAQLALNERLGVANAWRSCTRCSTNAWPLMNDRRRHDDE